MSIVETYDNIRKALTSHLLSNFPLRYGSSIEIGIENQKFKVPQNTPHLRSWVHHTSNRRASIGSTVRFERKNGFFMVNCYVPEDTGTLTMNKITQAVVDIFTDQKLVLDAQSCLITCTPEAKGETKLDGYYYVTVMIPFYTYGSLLT
jgi:Bacteriophage related domain of unknown function